MLDCIKCRNLLKKEESEIPDDFAAANYTLRRTHGYLQLSSIEMFHCFKLIESVIDRHFANTEHIFMRDAYEHVVEEIGSLNLIPISCDSHPDVLPFLILEYVQIRFYFESKKFKNLNLSQNKTLSHTSNKIAKTA